MFSSTKKPRSRLKQRLEKLHSTYTTKVEKRKKILEQIEQAERDAQERHNHEVSERQGQVSRDRSGN